MTIIGTRTRTETRMKHLISHLSCDQSKKNADETQIILNIKGRIFHSSLILSGLTLSPFLLAQKR